MATPKYTALATITLSSTDSEIVFANIPGTYRDLMLVVEGTCTGSADIFIKANSSTTGWTSVYMYGGSATQSGSLSTSYVSNQNTNRFNLIIEALDTTATNKHKTFLARASSAGKSEVLAHAVRWADTSAITSLGVYTGGNAFASGTTFSLYGVK